MLASITATTQQLDRIEIILTKSTCLGYVWKHLALQSQEGSSGVLWKSRSMKTREKRVDTSTGESFPGLNLEAMYFTLAYVPEVRFQGHT